MIKTFKLGDMKGGWFVGDFEPSAFRSDACEVACKVYKAGDREARHVHRVAVELTLIQSGRVRMEGVEYTSGDIVLLEPGTPSDFEVLEDTVTVVFKSPSAPRDKFPA